MNARVRPPNVDRFAMRAETAAASLDVSLTTFLGWVKEGKMPKPIKLRAVALRDYILEKCNLVC